MERLLRVQFCGFGGQGIVLAAVIFGTTAVTRAGLYAVQTQSYGSEARGGECQAEVIVSGSPIGSPLADEVDLLVAMSQASLDKYMDRLRAGGWVLYDPEFVAEPARNDVTSQAVPATKTAGDLGVALAANMIMLGYLQSAGGWFGADQLKDVVAQNVPRRFVQVNLKAVEAGQEMAQKDCFKLRVSPNTLEAGRERTFQQS